MRKDIKIYVAGHRGMVGSAVWRALLEEGFSNLIGKSRKEVDLKNQDSVNSFFQIEKPLVVVDAAARVGGILANNSSPYPFLMENLQIQNNLIDAAHRYEVEKFIFLGSSCIYPKLAPQPISEMHLLTGALEPTNEWYAIAKIAGVKACEAIRKQFGKDFVSLMPTNLYGPFDNFDLESSHVIPSMIRKFHYAKMNNHSNVVLWGSGTPMREFLHVDDLAKAIVFSLKNEMPEHLYNVGSGNDITIKHLAGIIQKAVGHKGEIVWDRSKPDGTPRKLMDSGKLKALGWKPSIELIQGIEATYHWFLNNQEKLKEVSL